MSGQSNWLIATTGPGECAHGHAFERTNWHPEDGTVCACGQKRFTLKGSNIAITDVTSNYLLPMPRTANDRAHIREAGLPLCRMRVEPGITLQAHDWLCAYRLCEECERQRAGEWTQKGLFETL